MEDFLLFVIFYIRVVTLIGSSVQFLEGVCHWWVLVAVKILLLITRPEIFSLISVPLRCFTLQLNVLCLNIIYLAAFRPWIPS